MKESDARAALANTIIDGRFVEGIEKLKRAKLIDIIQRARANSVNARDIAEEIALDWFPAVRFDPKGKPEIIVGTDRKR